jgi:hypothetical protein
LIYSHLAPVPIMFWIFSPFLTLIGLARYIANLTCDVPEWPESVEAVCVIEPGDRHERDARQNPPVLRPAVHDVPPDESEPGGESSKADSFVETGIRYEDVAWYRKRWFLGVTMLLFMPAAIAIAASGDIYAKRKGVVYKYGKGQRLGIVFGLSVLMAVYIFRFYAA